MYVKCKKDFHMHTRVDMSVGMQGDFFGSRMACLEDRFAGYNWASSRLPQYHSSDSLKRLGKAVSSPTHYTRFTNTKLGDTADRDCFAIQ